MKYTSNTWLCAALFIAIALTSVGRAADKIDEIIVSADFRERAASQLPASVTVLDSEQIESMAVQHFEELINTIPNLNWSGDGHRARYFQMRGVGELEQYQGAPNPSVGFLIDDIDFSGIGTVATLFDMQQVEILRGPQGTRYGANALGGLIYMRSTEPTEEFEGRVQLTVGDDDALAGGVAVSGPLSDAGSVAGRLSVHYHESNGFRDNPYLDREDTNGRDETTARGRLQWLPNDDWKVDVAAVLVDVDNGYDAFALDNSYTMLSDKPGRDAQKSTGASVRAEYSGWGDLTLTSITAFADSQIDVSFDADWGNEESWAPVLYDFISITARDRQTLSQELRLAAEQWVVGLYTMQLDEDLATLNQGEYYDPFYDYADSLDYPFYSGYEARNIAVFGEYEFALGETARLSLGLRSERRTSDYEDSDGLVIDTSDTMWGGELKLSVDLGDQAMGYFSISKGYKAGGFNLGLILDDLREFGDEQLINIEIGIKSRLLDGKLVIDAAVFHDKREDQQARLSFQLVDGDPTTFIFATLNVPQSETLGFEASLQWYPADAWSIYANIGLLEAQLGRIDLPGFELNDREQAHAPDYTLAVGTLYEHPSGFYGRLDVTARDEFYFDVSHDQQSRAYELVNARAGYRAENWSVDIWARNLFDKEYAVRGFYFGNEPPDFPSTLYTRLGDPRHFGVTFEKRF